LMSIDSSLNQEKLEAQSIKSTDLISQKTVPLLMKNDVVENEKSMTNATVNATKIRETETVNAKSMITVMNKNADLISASVIGIGTDIFKIIITATNALGNAIATISDTARYSSISGTVSTSLSALTSKYRDIADVVSSEINDKLNEMIELKKIKGNEYTFYIENINGLTGRDLADALQEELDNKISG